MAALPALPFLYKVSWSGTLGTQEIFAYSRWVTCDDALVQEDIADSYLDDVTDMLATAVIAGPVPNLKNAFASYCTWTQLKVSPWDQVTDKLIAGQAPAYRPLADTGAVGGTKSMPNQVSLSRTTRSALPGRRKYNRHFLPPLSALVTTADGLLDPSVADPFAQSLHLSLVSHSVSSVIPTNGVNYNPHYSGNTHPIVDIYLGRRLDVVRRRANKEPEPREILVM